MILRISSFADRASETFAYRSACGWWFAYQTRLFVQKEKKSMIYFSTFTAADRIIPLNHKTKYFISSSIYTGQITSLNTVLSSLDLSLYIWCQHGNLVSKENKKKIPGTTCHTYSSTKSLQVPLRSLSLARAQVTGGGSISRSGDRRRRRT